MTEAATADVYTALGRQGLGRSLTEHEQALAAALEAIFATGQHNLSEVARLLQERGVPRPSGATAPWSLAALQEELAQINASLDEAYERGGKTAGSPA